MEKILVLIIVSISFHVVSFAQATTPQSATTAKVISIGEQVQASVVHIVTTYEPISIGGDSVEVGTSYSTGSVYAVLDGKTYISLPRHSIDESLSGRRVASMKIYFSNWAMFEPDTWTCKNFTGGDIDAAFIVIDKIVVGVTPIQSLITTKLPTKGDPLTLYCSKEMRGPIFETKHSTYSYYDPRIVSSNMKMKEGWGLEGGNSGGVVCSEEGVVGITHCKETDDAQNAFYIPVSIYEELFKQ